ncbi:alpha-protein kinase vwka [Anaeramoeba flamelloides]|uniref:Alpha-protein kinase vwka n=1 Tax=Anaeramoeba flamelloides TaxID=1746091 RepID=A0ABQ8XBC9_9EUKA|nr:alpha-protein kinase vwka [Anaeramoeba flamelloides]
MGSETTSSDSDYKTSSPTSSSTSSDSEKENDQSQKRKPKQKQKLKQKQKHKPKQKQPQKQKKKNKKKIKKIKENTKKKKPKLKQKPKSLPKGWKLHSTTKEKQRKKKKQKKTKKSRSTSTSSTSNSSDLKPIQRQKGKNVRYFKKKKKKKREITDTSDEDEKSSEEESTSDDTSDEEETTSSSDETTSNEEEKSSKEETTSDDTSDEEENTSSSYEDTDTSDEEEKSSEEESTSDDTSDEEETTSSSDETTSSSDETKSNEEEKSSKEETTSDETSDNEETTSAESREEEEKTSDEEKTPISISATNEIIERRRNEKHSIKYKPKSNKETDHKKKQKKKNKHSNQGKKRKKLKGKKKKNEPNYVQKDQTFNNKVKKNQNKLLKKKKSNWMKKKSNKEMDQIKKQKKKNKHSIQVKKRKKEKKKKKRKLQKKQRKKMFKKKQKQKLLKKKNKKYNKKNRGDYNHNWSDKNENQLENDDKKIPDPQTESENENSKNKDQETNDDNPREKLAILFLSDICKESSKKFVGIKSYIQNYIEKIGKFKQGALIHYGMVGYRDFEDKKMYQYIKFITDTNRFTDKLEGISVSGGEKAKTTNVLGALNYVNRIKWPECQLKLLIHFPVKVCHGKEFGGPKPSTFSTRSTKKFIQKTNQFSQDGIIKKLRKSKIHWHMVTGDKRHETMFLIWKNIYDDPNNGIFLKRFPRKGELNEQLRIVRECFNTIKVEKQSKKPPIQYLNTQAETFLVSINPNKQNLVKLLNNKEKPVYLLHKDFNIQRSQMALKKKDTFLKFQNKNIYQFYLNKKNLVYYGIKQSSQEECRSYLQSYLLATLIADEFNNMLIKKMSAESELGKPAQFYPIINFIPTYYLIMKDPENQNQKEYYLLWPVNCRHAKQLIDNKCMVTSKQSSLIESFIHYAFEEKKGLIIFSDFYEKNGFYFPPQINLHNNKIFNKKIKDHRDAGEPPHLNFFHNHQCNEVCSAFCCNNSSKKKNIKPLNITRLSHVTRFCKIKFCGNPINFVPEKNLMLRECICTECEKKIESRVIPKFK